MHHIRIRVPVRPSPALQCTATTPGSDSTMLRKRRAWASGGGVPWVVDEHNNWYLPHERARFSCKRCSGDVVPEKDLLGCWPLWPQFAPD